MTSRTKRRLALLALALGLIAATPQMFRAVVDLLQPNVNILGAGAGFTLGAFQYAGSNRAVIFGIHTFALGYFTEADRSSIWLYYPGPSQVVIFKLPHESITLRIACAGALAGVWLLVVGGRLLARRWTRKNLPSVAA